MADEGTGTPAAAPAAPVPGVDDGHAAELLAQAAAASKANGISGAEDAPGDSDEVKRWKAYARTHQGHLESTNQKAAKLADDLKAARAALKEIADKDKSEAEKLREENLSNAERADKAERLVWRLKAAEDFEIPKGFRDSISGTTEDEIRESAKSLQAAIAEVKGSVTTDAASGGQGSGDANGKAPAGRQSARAARMRRPVEAMQSGAVPASAPAASGDPNEWFRELVEAKLGR